MSVIVVTSVLRTQWLQPWVQCGCQLWTIRRTCVVSWLQPFTLLRVIKLHTVLYNTGFKQLHTRTLPYACMMLSALLTNMYNCNVYVWCAYCMHLLGLIHFEKSFWVAKFYSNIFFLGILSSKLPLRNVPKTELLWLLHTSIQNDW